MSLFTVKDLWSLDLNEAFLSFTVNSLATGNIDNDPNEDVKLILGSLSGLLRIVGSPLVAGDSSPSTSASSNPQNGNLLAELHLGAPIIQVETGKFVSGSENIHLAVLHPHKFGVYSVSKLPGQVEHGSQYKVTLLYEHKLKRLAFNMCVGPFGRGVSSNLSLQSKERHFICVQSLDGTLSFFEHEVFTFSRYLPGFLLPGPLVYVAPWDSFLTVATSWTLQCFKYSSLAMSKDDANVQTQETAVGKKLSPEWTYSIGEEPIGNFQILYPSNDSAVIRIIIATFRHLFCFGVGGDLLWCKRLDYQINSIHSYLNTEKCCMTLAASGNETGAIYVYNGTTLKWAAKLPFVPIHICRIRLGGNEGMIVFLSAEGKLLVGYLGTEPSLFIAPPIHSRDLDYEAAEIELNNLRKIITEAGDQTVTASKDTTVEIKVEFEGQKTKWIESNGMEVMCLIATIKLVCHSRVNDVRVNICTPRPIVCTQESAMIGDIVGRHNYTAEFYVENDAVPSDLQCEVYVFYLSDTGVPHFVQKCGIKIPLFIVAKANDQLEREAIAKLTFAVNKPVLNLANLYNDFDWGPDASTIGLTFRLRSNDKVTLLASTKTNTSSTSRYRIQSNSIAAMHIIFRDFMDRLYRKFSREKSDLQINLVSSENEIPLLNEYFSEIDAHILRRRREIQIKDDLSGRAAQLRAIQRRLLIRFRDKNPLPLTQLEILFDGSLEHINDALNFMEENEIEKQKSESRVSGATRLILELLQIQSGRSSEEMSLLSSALSPHVLHFIEERGWEECVFTGLTYLKSQVISNNDFSQLDPSKLKKAIKSTLDKVRKASQPPVVIPEAKNQNEDEPEKLIGNEIIERMASARARTARKRNPNPVLASIPEPAEEERETATPPLQTEESISNATKFQESEDVLLENDDEIVENVDSDVIPEDMKGSISREESARMMQKFHDDGSQDDNFW